MKLYETMNLKIDDLAMGGDGVGRAEGLAVFVPGSVPGDELNVQLVDLKKNYARGKIIDIVKPSMDRVEPKCPLALACGGCQWQHVSYPAQLKFKTKIVQDTLERLGKLKDLKVSDIIGMEDPWGFRNKIQYPIGNAKRDMSDAKIVMGYYKQGTHEIVNIDNCPIEHPKLSRVAKIVKDVLNKLDYPAFDEGKTRGLFRHLRARIGFGTGEVILTFVTGEKAIPEAKNLIKEVITRCKKNDINIVGICQNLNPIATNVVLGETNRTMWGRDHICDKIGELKFKVSNTSFYQTNPVQMEVLYNKALEYALLSGKETVIDAYSGIGTVALWFAKHAQFVYGIEEGGQAVCDAAENAEQNKIENCRFNVGKVERLLTGLKEGDVLILDPPRGGCEEKVLKTIARSNFKKIIYISCNPSTLARDLAYLSNEGFSVDQVQPVDMFPHSFHIETVTRIIKK
ncbi:MAG: 23S rRNA (uracil(1939)-C(5))-methyltransferase RlmD [bacterium]